MTKPNEDINGPVRTYDEIVAAMRAKGDATITRQHISWYLKSAFNKLRPLLADLEEEIKWEV